MSLPNLANLRLKSLAIRKKKDEREENPVESLLKPIGSLEGDYDSDVSEISDVFEEFHKNSYLKPQNKHYLTKHEADVRTMEEFTDDFKKTIAGMRKDLGIGEELLLESPKDITTIVQDEKSSGSFPKISIKKEITEMLDDETDTIPSPEELQKNRKPSDTSSGSIIWHMLAANSDNKKFEISPPGFDTFKQKQPHWLQRASVSWVDVDHATLKCENWLERHCQESTGKKTK